MTCARVMRGISSMAKAATLRLGQALQGRLLAVGVHDGDDEGAGLDARQLALGRAAHLEDDVGVPQGLLGAWRRSWRPAASNSASVMPAVDAGPGLDHHIGAEGLVLLDRLGRGGDACLRPVGFGENGDPHQATFWFVCSGWVATPFKAK